MSIFNTVELPCPACETAVSFELVASVSADRRPDLREAILDGSFQREACPSCGSTFRVDPEFTYLDIARGQYIAVWPVAKRDQWQACVERSQESFDNAFGKGATRAAAQIGKKVQPRVVFGWPALLEKVLANEAGIDDRTLEIAKVAVLSNESDLPLPGHRELRLVGERDGDLLLAWVRTDGEQRSDALLVPRAVIAEIEADPASWQGVRDDLAEGGLVVDFQREMLVG
jgi:CpXC protein